MPSLSERVAACGKLGSPIEPSDFAPSFAEILADILKDAEELYGILRIRSIHPWNKQPFCITFTDGLIYNARATKREGCDYIIIPIGVIESLAAAAYCLMATPSFLPRIGNVEREPGIPPMPNGFPRFPFYLIGQEDEPLPPFIPVCPIRRTYALHLVFYAANYLIWHEMGHIFGGHLERLKPGVNGFAMLPEDDDRELLDIPRRVLEADADAFANYYKSLFSMSKGTRKLTRETFVWRGVSENHAAFITFATSMGIALRLGETKPSRAPAFMGQYPAPVVRANLAVSTALSASIRCDLIAEPDATRLVQSSILEITRAWERLKLPNMRLGPYREWRALVGLQSEKLFSEYRALIPELNKTVRIYPEWYDIDWTPI